MKGPGKKIIAVLFEVIPISGFKEEYLNISRRIQPELEKINGFISVERFESLHQPGKLLSLSYWENVKALKEWKNSEAQRNALKREYLLKFSRLNIVEIISEIEMPAEKLKPKYRRQVKEFGRMPV